MDVFGVIAKDSLCLVLDPKGLFLCFLYNTEKFFCFLFCNPVYDAL